MGRALTSIRGRRVQEGPGDRAVAVSVPTDLGADSAPAETKRKTFLPPDAVEEGVRAVLGGRPRPKEHRHLDLALSPDLSLQGSDLENFVSE